MATTTTPPSDSPPRPSPPGTRRGPILDGRKKPVGESPGDLAQRATELRTIFAAFEASPDTDPPGADEPIERLRLREVP